MIKNGLLLFFALNSAIIFSQEIRQDKSGTKPEIYLIGSIHSSHFNPDNHYSINDLMTQIRALKPDIVCGEITPEAYDKAMEGYFPPEAAFLAKMASEINYRFVPVDWRLDYATQFKAESEYPLSIKNQCSELLNNSKAKLKEFDSQSMYDFIHSDINLKIIDSLYEKIIGINAIAEIAHGSWHERNRRIVENGLAAAGNARRIVFVFGSDHLPQLQRQLKILGIEAQIPKRMFIPSNNFKVLGEVLERWKRNLENLKQIRDKKTPTSYDNYQKIINSRRIQDLELVIEKSIN
jgi:hypothetical protein